eukprot:1161787-Pelagomonas_calceolata.AAC.1
MHSCTAGSGVHAQLVMHSWICTAAQQAVADMTVALQLPIKERKLGHAGLKDHTFSSLGLTCEPSSNET